MATAINSLVWIFIAEISWLIAYLKLIPSGSTSEFIMGMSTVVPWYYHMPFVFISMTMLFRWLEYTFKLESVDFSWRAIKYKFLYGITFLLILESILRALFLTIYLYYR